MKSDRVESDYEDEEGSATAPVRRASADAPDERAAAPPTLPYTVYDSRGRTSHLIVIPGNDPSRPVEMKSAAAPV